MPTRVFLTATLAGISSAAAPGATEVKTKTLAIALMLCLFTQLAMAQTNEEIKQARSHLADDLQQCSLFFLVASTCVADQDAAVALSYRKASDELGKLAISSSRAAGVSKNAFL